MKLAILGGSFDPPHLGHYFVTRQILEARPDIEKILLVPAGKHQWKEIIAPAKDRLAMLSDLEDKNITISHVELTRNGISYTLDTLQEIKKETNAELYWIVGSDILSELDKWDKTEGLMEYAKFLVFPRDPYLLPDKLPLGFEAIKTPHLITSNISSTAIRERIKKNLPLTNFVPKNVEEYITKHGLYK